MAIKNLLTVLLFYLLGVVWQNIDEHDGSFYFDYTYSTNMANLHKYRRYQLKPLSAASLEFVGVVNKAANWQRDHKEKGHAHTYTKSKDQRFFVLNPIR